VGGEKSNRVFQPHDAHIPHHLQFMCDYNLVGMGIITGLTASPPFLTFLLTFFPANSITCHVPSTPARRALPANPRRLPLQRLPRRRRVERRFRATGGVLAELPPKVRLVRSCCVMSTVAPIC
jgi:hypothetical protein